MTTCLVCSNSPASYHFGATTCRACAAFFRRCVITKKPVIYCNCFIKRVDSYPCRYCRMKKCIAVGMRASEVQSSRDGNDRTNKKIVSCEPSTSTPFPDLFGFSRIGHGISSRNQGRLSLVVKSYRDLELARNLTFSRGERQYPVELSLDGFSFEVMLDLKLQWKFCEAAFPEFSSQSQMDEKILFYNFCIRWSFLEVSMYATKRHQHIPYRFYSPSGAVTKSVSSFYENTGTLNRDEVDRIFGSIWKYHFENTINPLVRMKLGEIESMALFGLLLWDPGYTNINDELAEKCHSMRKIILRELKSCCDDERRFFEILDSINLIERSEQKCREEITLLGVYNIHIDEERRRMISWDKY